MTGTDIIPRATIAELCGHRDRALAAYGDALAAAERATRAAEKAAPYLRHPSHPKAHVAVDYSRYGSSADDWRKAVDSWAWRSVMERFGLEDLMSAKQRASFREQIDKKPAEFTEANVRATFADLAGKREDIFRQSIIDVFATLPRAYKSHDGFKIGKRIVVTYAVSHWAGDFHFYISSHRSKRDEIDDLDRAFHVLDGKPYGAKATDAATAAMQRSEREVTTSYLKLRWFENGNAHLWMLREDLVRDMNRILAEHYGAALARA